MTSEYRIKIREQEDSKRHPILSSARHLSSNKKTEELVVVGVDNKMCILINAIRNLWNAFIDEN